MKILVVFCVVCFMHSAITVPPSVSLFYEISFSIREKKNSETVMLETICDLHVSFGLHSENNYFVEYHFSVRYQSILFIACCKTLCKVELVFFEFKDIKFSCDRRKYITFNYFDKLFTYLAIKITSWLRKRGTAKAA